MSLLKKQIYDKFSPAAEYLQKKLHRTPGTFVVAGSGIGDALSEIDFSERIPFSEIPRFPQVGVEGHVGELLVAEINGAQVGIFTGRFHLYEGRDVGDALSQVIVAHLLGAKKFILTNAAGGLNPSYCAGDLMLIRDYIDMTFRPLTSVFTEEAFANAGSSVPPADYLSDLASKIAGAHVGVYLGVTGPTYETPAEIRAYRELGGDAIGMSTTLEAKASLLLGLSTLGASIITNELKEIRTAELKHTDVLAIASKSRPKTLEFLRLAVDSY
ncbi:MAG: purine-nucleoside phosphorylase [Chloroflexota bacterium]